MVNLEYQELQDGLELLVDLQLSVKSSTSLHATHVLPGHPVRPDRMGCPEIQEGVVVQDDQVIQGLLEHQVKMVLLGNQVRLEQTVKRENQDDQRKVQTQFPVTLDHQETQDHLVCQDLMGSLVVMDNLVKLDHPDLPDRLGLLDLLVHQETLVHQDSLDCKENAGSVLNIVRWMEVFSSKMEHGAKQF